MTCLPSWGLPVLKAVDTTALIPKRLEYGARDSDDGKYDDAVDGADDA